MDYSAVSHVADYISGKSDIRNLKAYLRSALYKAVGEISQKPAPPKPDYKRAALVVRGGLQAGNISPRNITAPAVFPFAGSFVGGAVQSGSFLKHSGSFA